MAVRKARHFRTVVWITGTALLFWALVWFVRPFLIDKSLGKSRLLNGWHDPRYVAFHRLFFEIESGMSRFDLEAVIHRVYLPDGNRTPPRFWVDEPTHIILLMDPEDRQAPNCEAITLRISNGTITGKTYSMD